MGRGGVRPRPRRGPRGARLDRLLRLPLVPRDGARELRERRDRGADERALRLHQGRPRGAPRRRRDLHGRDAGDDRRRRLAAQRLPHPRRDPVLVRHLLPARAAPGDAELAERAAGDRRGVGRAARGDPLAGRGDRRAPARRGRDEAAGGGDRPRLARRRRRRPAQALRPGARRLRPRPEVPAVLGDRVPARARRARDGAAHAAPDGLGRHVRPDRRRLRALLGRPHLARPPLREDALRQRAARPRVPARLAGHRRAAVRARVPRDARLGAHRAAPGGGRVRLRARRGLRGRRGQVLRLDARRRSARCSATSSAPRRSSTSG